MTENIIKTTPYIWQTLRADPLPKVLYGMGNGAESILALCRKHGVEISGIFASDDFCRYQDFMGFTVKKYDDIKQSMPDFTVLLAFATCLPDVMAHIAEIASERTLYAPFTPLFGGGEFTPNYALSNCGEMDKARSLLGDELSRSVFDNIIRFRLSGDISRLAEITTPREDVFRDVLLLGKDCRYLDLGAYNGDTIAEFLAVTDGSYRSMSAFEPENKNREKLLRSVEGLDNCRVYPYAAWSRRETLKFNGRSGRMAAIADTGRDVQAEAPDNVTDGADYIKMDIEGAEREALLGCRRIISECSPYLAVSAYHRIDDFFALPLLIHSIYPNGKIFLRRHPYIPDWETNIYVSP